MAIDVERADHVAIVTMNRPDALNAFNSDQLESLLDVLRDLRRDPSVRCVILTGAGQKAFAAGADIKEMAEKSSREGLAFGRLGHAVVNALEGLPRPTIAAVNGFALGGGAEIALGCDLRLASENAVFAQPEVTLGIPPGWGATQRLPRLVGPGVAADLIFTGRQVKADEALRIGLVNAVYPLDQLMNEARNLAAAIARNSPKALAAAKQAMKLALNGDTPAGLASELELFGHAFGTADQREGMRAFVEKRPPSFTGE
ncbi:MAG: enoyl-CoA hydratase/isomerase family protein [Thermomicrobiales bacterium]